MLRRPVVLLVLALALSACAQYASARQSTRASTTAAAVAAPTTAVGRTTAPLPVTGTTDPLPTTAPEPEPAPSTPKAPTGPPTPVSSPPGPGPTATPSEEPFGRDVAAYAGLGTWIDMYDNEDVFGPQAYADPQGITAEMARRGVRTLYLEAGSYRHPSVAFPTATAKLIRAAHANGLRVIAWYLPLFDSVRDDLDAVLRVLRFRTADGQTYDGFALDIEAAIVPPQRRIANFLRLSARIRAIVGPDTALGAIIPSPRGLIRVPTYWPGFPYDRLQDYYDVVLPMSYFTFHDHGAAAVAQYVRDNVTIVRRETGDPDVRVHVIGGIADDMTPDETRAFVSAARDVHVFGASLYEFPRTSAFQWRTLAPLR